MIIEQPQHRPAAEPYFRPLHPLIPEPVVQEAALSVVIPTLNEAANIGQLLLRLHAALTEAAIPYEAIIVDDHSRDGTCAVATRVAAEHVLPVRVLTKRGRPGKSFSLLEGFHVARFDVLAMLDGDLQYPPEALPTMVKQLREADIVVGDRRSSYQQVSRMRGALSRTFRAAFSVGMFGIDTDMQSGMKVFYREVYEQVTLRPSAWSIDIDLLTQAAHKGFAIANVAIPYHQRLGGESKVSPMKVGAELILASFRLKATLMARDSVHGMVKYGILPLPDDRAAASAQAAVAVQDARTETLMNAMRFEHWLLAQADRKLFAPNDATVGYVEAALQPMSIGRQQVQTYSPLQQQDSAIQTLTVGQMIFLTLFVLVYTAGMLTIGPPMLVASLAALTLFYLGDMLVTFCLTVSTISKNPEEQIPDEVIRAIHSKYWPVYTVLCPLYKEVEIVPQFVKAMQAMDYPADRLQILFLTEENDAATRDAILALKLPPHFEVVTVPNGEPRTKPRACNYGLLRATGEYVVIFDAEDIPDPMQLKKAVLSFANHGADLACVQAKLNFYNAEQNLLTRWFTVEYTLWFNLILPGLQKLQSALPLGGTSNHFRTSVLRAVGGWDPFNVTEDCDLGLRLAQHRYHTVMLDSTTMEEATSRVKNWVRQRSRWIKGYMQTYWVHMRRPVRYLREGRLRDFASLQLVVGGKPAMLFINPMLWVLLAVYLGFRQQVEQVYHVLYPAPVFYMGMICLVFGNFLYMYTYLIACARRGEYGLMKWALLVPIYWALMSVAAMVAVFQLVYNPFFWEKTQHGMHLKKPQIATPSLALTNLDTIYATIERITETGIQTITPVDRPSSYMPTHLE